MLRWTLATAMLTALATASHMNLADLLPDEAKEIRTTLPDGRMHVKFESTHHFLPKKGTVATAGFSHDMPENADALTFGDEHPDDRLPIRMHLRYEGVIKSEWKMLDVTKHAPITASMGPYAADHANLRCIDNVDHHPHAARVYVKHPSAELRDAAVGASRRLEFLVITAPVVGVSCHGEPLFRQVHDARYDADTDTLHLTTKKGRYDQVFDDMDVHFESSRLVQTHSDDDVAEHGVGTGVYPGLEAPHASPFPRPPHAEIHHVEAEPTERPFAKEMLRSRFGDAVDAVDANGKPVPLPGQPRGWWLMEKGLETADDDVAVLTDDPDVTKKVARRFKRQGWWKKVKKGVKKVVKKVSKAVTKVWKKAKAALKQVGSRIVAAVKSQVSKYAAKIARIATAIKRFAQAITGRVNVNVDLNKGFSGSFGGQGEYKKVKSLFYKYNLRWRAGVGFRFQISDNRLMIIRASAYGGAGVSFSAKFKGDIKLGDGADTILYTQDFPNINFVIVIVPVIITNKVPIVAGYSYEFSDNSWATAALSLSGDLEAGFEYTRENGFRLIARREFTRSATLDYSLQMEFIGMAYMQLIYSGALYAMVVGSGIGQFDVMVNLNTQDANCGVKAQISCGLELLVGLEIDIGLFGFTIWRKDFGRKSLFKKRWDIANFCRRVTGTSGSFGHSRDFHLLAANATQEGMIDTIGADDSGMTWTAQQSCGNGVVYDFAITGFFGENVPGADDDDDDNSTDSSVTPPPTPEPPTPVPTPWPTLPSGVSLINGSTLMTVIITRNVTNFSAPINDTGRYMYSTQRSLVGFEGLPRPGLAVRAEIVTEELFEEMGFANVTSSAFSTDNNQSSVMANPQNVSFIDFVFGSHVTTVQASVPSFCQPRIDMRSQLVNGTLPSGNAALNDLLTIQFDPPKGFAYTIRVALALCLTFAFVSLLVLLRRQNRAPERFTQQADARGTDYKVLLGVFVPTVVLVTVLGLVGWSFEYAVIEGMWADQNATVPNLPDTYQWRQWTFQWWSVTVMSCPQPEFCIPNCRDNCSTLVHNYKQAPWPYCPDCNASYPWTVAFFSVLAFLCVIAAGVSIQVFDQKVKRALAVTFFSFMFSLMVYMNMQRIMINIRDAYLDYFATAPEMVVAYGLTINPKAEKCWRGMVAFGFILPAVATIMLIVAFVQKERDAKLREVKATETLQEAVDESLMAEKYEPTAAEEVDKKLNEAAKGGLL